MQQQDSSDPTGVAEVTPSTDKTAIRRARERKANAALQLRMAGAEWSLIAETLGFPTPRTAMVAVEKALEKELHDPEAKTQMRRMAGMRLERLLRGTWEKAIDPNHPEHLVAVQRSREIIGQHSKLFGLDAPTEVTVTNPTMNEIEAFVSRVVHAATPPVEEYDIIDIEPEDEPRALSAG